MKRFIFFFLSLLTTATAHALTGRVVKVADGDTITILDASKTQQRIRLSGIDAPERNQPYGAASKKNMSALAGGKDALAICHKKDRYKRHICIVYVNGVDVSIVQLDAGLAWVYRQYVGELPGDLQSVYMSVEEGAANAKIGLWRDANPVPPWE